jgi:flagellar motility protein MotE (MotC chaperone)
MKPPIVFLAAFLASTGVSAGAKFAMTPAPLPPKPAVADSLKKAADDSLKKETGDVSGEAGAEKAPSGETSAELPKTAATKPETAKPATETAVAATGPATAAPVAAIKPAPRSIELEKAVAKAIAAASNTPKDTATVAAERRVSKIFTSMEAKQAAKVLEQMADGDIEIILGYVGPRQAAAILAELKPERVAALSKIAMKPSKQ